MTPMTRLLCGTIMVVSCASCASSGHVVQERIDNAPDLSELATYTWNRASLAVMAPAEQVSSDLSDIIRNEIDAALASKGYRRVNGVPADMTVDFRVTIKVSAGGYVPQNTTDVLDIDTEFGLRWRFAGGETPVAVEPASPAEEIAYYDEGTLHVGVFDSANEMVWHVFSHKIIDSSHSPEGHREVLRDAVQNIMRRFPEKSA